MTKADPTHKWFLPPRCWTEWCYSQPQCPWLATGEPDGTCAAYTNPRWQYQGEQVLGPDLLIKPISGKEYINHPRYFWPQYDSDRHGHPAAQSERKDTFFILKQNGMPWTQHLKHSPQKSPTWTTEELISTPCGLLSSQRSCPLWRTTYHGNPGEVATVYLGLTGKSTNCFAEKKSDPMPKQRNPTTGRTKQQLLFLPNGM